MSLLTRSLALGFAATLWVQGASAALIRIYDTDSAMNSIADAQAVIAAGGADATAYSANIWFSDVGTNPGGWGSGLPFPGGFNETFVVSIAGQIDTNLYSHLWLAHDDGVQLSTNGATLYEFGAPTDFRDSGALSLGGATGQRTLSGIFYENGGEADLFLWGYLRSAGTWEIARVGDPVSVPEPPTLALVGLSLLLVRLASRRRALRAK